MFYHSGCMGLYWSKLQQGDCVDVVAPGMRPAPETLKGIQAFLNSWGLRVRVAKDLIGNDLVCSNTKEYRSKNLRQALLAEDSKMIWCLRGGYGSLHLLPDLKSLKPKNIKLFVGLSDITTLHSYFHQEWNWATLHACNLDRLVLNKTTPTENKRLLDVLFGEKKKLQYKIKPLNTLALKERSVESVVVGGNLITLQSSFGTPYQLKTENKILFFEDIGERAYRLDRVFTQMEQMGLWKGVKAVIFGQFTGSKEPEGRDLVPRLLKEFAQKQKFPVFGGLAVGHGENQHPLPLNTKARIVSGTQSRLEIETGCLGG